MPYPLWTSHLLKILSGILCIDLISNLEQCTSWYSPESEIAVLPDTQLQWISAQSFNDACVRHNMSRPESGRDSAAGTLLETSHRFSKNIYLSMDCFPQWVSCLRCVPENGFILWLCSSFARNNFSSFCIFINISSIFFCKHRRSK